MTPKTTGACSSLFFTLILIFTVQITATTLFGHGKNRKTVFPNTPGFVTLACDFHQHTVFSDGSVWPDIRVEEALKDGLDAISITDHLEYQPHKDDIPHPDRNRSFDIAKKSGKGKELMIIRGAEITRKMPPGHANAIFINDANLLLQEDVFTVFREAKKQGAFTFWNHPNWTSQKKDGIASLTEMHKELIAEELLNGIEVVNEFTYSEEAFQIALDNNLTVIGTSDIHGLIDWEYNVPEGGHRPITLVFAKEKTESSLKEALFAGRTVVWFNNILIGNEEFLAPLINSSIDVAATDSSKGYQGKSMIWEVVLTNNSSADFILKNKSEFSLHSHADLVELKAFSTVKLEVKTLKKIESFRLTFDVINAYSAPKTNPQLKIIVGHSVD
ncbi:MAG: PHP domain-containing protein [Melioribacteraceae bacterium]|nr:PHP domain-containing protein [Melioribacteraceae bacterium]MCF8263082.1 PHP domain-containing protein [Melioribacteraceae bacterium]MCF8431356.1 PHP domain-containing protein [Melioribacteraceae bacterium]